MNAPTFLGIARCSFATVVVVSLLFLSFEWGPLATLEPIAAVVDGNTHDAGTGRVEFVSTIDGCCYWIVVEYPSFGAESLEVDPLGTDPPGFARPPLGWRAYRRGEKVAESSSLPGRVKQLLDYRYAKLGKGELFGSWVVGEFAAERGVGYVVEAEFDPALLPDQEAQPWRLGVVVSSLRLYQDGVSAAFGKVALVGLIAIALVILGLSWFVPWVMSFPLPKE